MKRFRRLSYNAHSYSPSLMPGYPCRKRREPSRPSPPGRCAGLDRSRLAPGHRILRARDGDTSGGGSEHGYSTRKNLRKAFYHLAKSGSWLEIWLEKLVRKWLGMGNRVVQSTSASVSGIVFKPIFLYPASLVNLTKAPSIQGKRHPAFFKRG